MARHKEFNQKKVLERAMRLFWRQGYEATSINDLVEYMGINRGSIYDTFGGKQSLYYAALEHYKQSVGSEAMTPLAEMDSPLLAIKQVFANLVDEAICDQLRGGCFTVNAAVELAAHDNKIASDAKDTVCDMASGFQGTLDRAVKRGELRSDADTVVLARFLVNNVLGIRTMAKMNPDRRILNDVVKASLSLLD